MNVGLRMVKTELTDVIKNNLIITLINVINVKVNSKNVAYILAVKLTLNKS